MSSQWHPVSGPPGVTGPCLVTRIFESPLHPHSWKGKKPIPLDGRTGLGYKGRDCPADPMSSTRRRPGASSQRRCPTRDSATLGKVPTTSTDEDHVPRLRDVRLGPRGGSLGRRDSCRSSCVSRWPSPARGKSECRRGDQHQRCRSDEPVPRSPPHAEARHARA